MKSKIELDFNGTILGFHFGLSFLGYFYEKHDLDVVSMYNKINDVPFSFIPLLMFESYKHNAERKGETPSITKYDLADLIDDTGGLHEDDGCAAKFMNVFVKSILSRLPSDKDAKEVKKK